MGAKVVVIGKMSEATANKVKMINALANLILKIGVVSSFLIVSFAYCYSQLLK